ncbi:MAG: hypothetical protein RLZZ507_4681 [Cyanobacteriota bacterium]
MGETGKQFTSDHVYVDCRLASPPNSLKNRYVDICNQIIDCRHERKSPQINGDAQFICVLGVGSTRGHSQSKMRGCLLRLSMVCPLRHKAKERRERTRNDTALFPCQVVLESERLSIIQPSAYHLPGFHSAGFLLSFMLHYEALFEKSIILKLCFEASMSYYDKSKKQTGE